MSTREPPQSAPRSTFMTRFTRRPLRPLVLLVSGLAALWSLFSMIGAFRVFSYENSNSLKHLAPISLALGIVYGVVMGTQLFGFVAAQTQKPGLIQTYSFLSILGGVGIAATGFIEVVVHFVFKTDLINECSSLADGQVVFYGWGLFGPSRSDVLDSSEARSFCNNAYSRDSVNVVVSALVLSFYGFILATIGRAYLQQVRDPAFGRVQAPVGTGAAYSMPVYPPGPPQGGFAPPAGPPPGAFAPPAGPPPGAFAPPPGPPPATGYGYGAGAGASKDPFADQKGVMPTPDPKDDPFADFERIPDAERDGARRS